MEVHFTPERQARLDQVAARTGKDPQQLIDEAIDRMLDYDERFLAAVEEGRESVRRGDVLEHDEVVERIERLCSAPDASSLVIQRRERSSTHCRAYSGG